MDESKETAEKKPLLSSSLKRYCSGMETQTSSLTQEFEISFPKSISGLQNAAGKIASAAEIDPNAIIKQKIKE